MIGFVSHVNGSGAVSEHQEMELIRVLEVDQFTSTGNIKDFGFDDFDIYKVTGGDSESAQKGLFYSFRERVVSVNATPSIGTVWFKEDPETKKFVHYKANYDTSD